MPTKTRQRGQRPSEAECVPIRPQRGSKKSQRRPRHGGKKSRRRHRSGGGNKLPISRHVRVFFLFFRDFLYFSQDFVFFFYFKPPNSLVANGFLFENLTHTILDSYELESTSMSQSVTRTSHHFYVTQARVGTIFGWLGKTRTSRHVTRTSCFVTRTSLTTKDSK